MWNVHFVLLVIDLENNRSIILDSIRRTFEIHYDRIFKRSYLFIQLIKESNELDSINILRHRYFICENQPRQPNGSLDCGIYVIHYCQYLIYKDKSVFNLPSFTKRYLINLILNENEINQNELNQNISIFKEFIDKDSDKNEGDESNAIDNENVKVSILSEGESEELKLA